MNQITFPELYCPFTSQVNRYVDVLEKNTSQWVLRYELVADDLAYKRFIKAQFFLLAAGTYPKCELEKIKIANDWLSWMMTWDDICENDDLGRKPELLAVFHKRFIEILSGVEINSQDLPRSHALHNLRQRIIQQGGEKWLPYFVQTVKEYLQGCVLEARNLKQRNIPNLESCIKIRQSSVAAYTFLELIPFCDRLEIPDAVRVNSSFKQLQLMTNNILTWCNDIFSAPKEMADDDFHNIVLSLFYQHKLPFDKAMLLSVKMHDEELKALIRLAKSFPSFGDNIDADIAKYISGLYAWIRGNFDWSSRTRRYHSLDTLKSITELVAV